MVNKYKPITVYDSSLNRIGILEDYEDAVYTRNFFECGDFSIKINANIPQSALLTKGAVLIFGDDPRDSGIITKLNTELQGEDSPYGKGNEIITASGYDCRYIFARRIIRELNADDTYYESAHGETIIKHLIDSQCGTSASVKRRFTNMTINADSARGSNYTISTKYTTVYEECATAALQSGIGWYVYPDVTNKTFVVDCEVGVDRSISQSVNPFCIFSPSFESIRGYSIDDDIESFRNLVYVGGDGQGAGRTIHTGYTGTEPEGFDRYEMFDDASSLSTTTDLQTEAAAVLAQYAQSIAVDSDGLILSPFMYKENYEVGDIVTLQYRGYSLDTRIKTVTESWAHGDYDISYTFGKPVATAASQIGAISGTVTRDSSISESGTNVSGMKNGIKEYDLTSADITMLGSECIYNVLRLTGTLAANRTLTLYLDTTRLYGRKVYTLVVEASGGKNITIKTSETATASVIVKADGASRVVHVSVDDTGNVTIGADDSEYVHISGNETIAGVKTFSSSPIVPPADSSGEAVSYGQAKHLSDRSRVIQLNGDGIPVIPDNVAGTEYIPNFSTTDSWGVNNSSLSVSSNILKITAATSALYGASRSFSVLNGNIARLRIRTSRATEVYMRLYGGSSYPIIGHVLTSAGVWTVIDGYATGSVNGILYVDTVDGATSGDTIEISQENTYVGSGLYDTPPYDKACCSILVNHGVVPVKGKRGLALLFQGGQWIEANIPVTGITGTISFILTTGSDVINRQRILSNRTYSPNAGISASVYNGELRVEGSDDEHWAYNVMANTDYTLSFDFTPTTYAVSINGVQVTSGSAAFSLATSVLYIGRAAHYAGEYLKAIIHDLRYTSSVMTADEKIRYYIGDDAVDSQQKAITNVPNAIKICDSKGHIRQPGLPVYADNTAALAGGLVAGEPYRTSTGVLMIVY